MSARNNSPVSDLGCAVICLLPLAAVTVGNVVGAIVKWMVS